MPLTLKDLIRMISLGVFFSLEMLVFEMDQVFKLTKITKDEHTDRQTDRQTPAQQTDNLVY